MRYRGYLLTIAAGFATAIGVVGFTSAVAQYYTIERQMETVKSIALTRETVIDPIIKQTSDVVSGDSVIPSLKDYESNAGNLTQALSLDTATMLRRQELNLAGWSAVTLLSGFLFLCAHRLRWCSNPVECPDLLEIPARTEEVRSIIIGRIKGKHSTGIITYRGENIRIISVRRARPEEVAIYES